MDERGLRQRDVVVASGLSRALVSKYVADDRDHLTRLPDRVTLEGLARALGVSTEFLLSKAVEALGLGYEAGDFVSTVQTAPSAELLDELRHRVDRLERRNEGLEPNEVAPMLLAVAHEHDPELFRLHLEIDVQPDEQALFDEVAAIASYRAAYEAVMQSREEREALDRHGDQDATSDGRPVTELQSPERRYPAVQEQAARDDEDGR